MYKYLLVLFFITAGSLASPVNISIADSTSTPDSAVSTVINEKSFAERRDSVLKLVDVLRKDSETKLYRFRDSLTSGTIKAIDVLLPAAEMKIYKDSLKIVNTKTAAIKKYIAYSIEKLLLKESEVFAVNEKTINDSLNDSEIYEVTVESINNISDEGIQVISDSVAVLIESFGEYVGELRQSELDKPADITIGISFATHGQSNMRDDGISQFSSAPSVSVRLPWGFSAGYAIGYYPDATKKLDGSTFGLGYAVSLSKKLSLSGAYSYFAFSNTSNKRQALFHNAMSVAASYTASNIYLSSGGSFYLGQVQDPAIYIQAGRLFTLTNDNSEIGVTMMPDMNICWGSQDPTITLRIPIGKNGKPLPPPKNPKKPKFGILGYELSLPIDFTYKKLTVKLSTDYIMPVNVADKSNSSSYFNFGFGMDYAIRIF